MAVRIVFALLIVVGAAAFIGRWVSGPAEVVPEPAAASANLAALPLRFLRSLARFTLIFVPEHLALVFVIGLIAPWLTGVFGLEAQLGAGAVLIAAVAATLLVIPTGGEIPIILTLVPLGVGTGVTGALLIALPALSIPRWSWSGEPWGGRRPRRWARPWPWPQCSPGECWHCSAELLTAAPPR